MISFLKWLSAIFNKPQGGAVKQYSVPSLEHDITKTIEPETKVPIIVESKLPEQYQWLEQEQGPAILLEALKLYGTTEIKGPKHNQTILDWADEVNSVVGAWYDKDEYAWCALFFSLVSKRAGIPPRGGFNAIRALEQRSWGTPVKDAPMLGDALIFKRTGGGHVGLYVGEDEEAFHVLGGNQSNTVNITRIGKDKLIEARRSPWIKHQPKNVRVVHLSATGELSNAFA